MRILVAGMGNVLHRDDGFGPEVANALADRALPRDVTVMDVGTGGIHLVQALLDGYEALIVVDAVQRDGDPGTLYVLEPTVPELSEYSPEERHEMLVDMHYTVPSRAMILARALDSLPSRVWIVGCQPGDADEPGIGLTDPVAAAVPEAVARIEALIRTVRGDPTDRPEGERNPT